MMSVKYEMIDFNKETSTVDIKTYSLQELMEKYEITEKEEESLN